MYFTSNIKFLRKRRGRTQDDVAVALNLKRSTLSGYENGVAQPGIDILVSFSGYFNMSIDTLLKIDMTRLSESQLGELERGYDAYVKGSNLRVLTTTVNLKTGKTLSWLPKKQKQVIQQVMPILNILGNFLFSVCHFFQIKKSTGHSS